MSEKLGYTCPCGHWNAAGSGWAAAHWDLELKHTCQKCGQKNIIQSGEFLREDTWPRGETLLGSNL